MINHMSIPPLNQKLMGSAAQLMEQKINARKRDSAFRKLRVVTNLVDFSSNDYLGFSRSSILNQLIKDRIAIYTDTHPEQLSGATGSRLLSGNSAFAEELEEEIASIHQADNGLIFNAGYTANIALFSCLPQKGDTIITDEYIHASTIDGARLSFARRLKFRHNNLEDLEAKLRKYSGITQTETTSTGITNTGATSTGITYVAVESVYSMDGDMADLVAIAALCRKYGAEMIVDEAHAFGVFGTGLVDELGLQDQVFARIITFGKALGLHGAIVIGSQLLKDFLVNFARPFIYSTALPLNTLFAIQTAYNYLMDQKDLKRKLLKKSELFISNMPAQHLLSSTTNLTAIQCVFVTGNTQVKMLSAFLATNGFDVRAILSPTVPDGKERVRVCLHLHNTDEEILSLCQLFHQALTLKLF